MAEAVAAGNLIGGRWVAGAEPLERRNPSDLSDIVGRFGAAAPGDVDAAVAAARQALPGWAGTSFRQRETILRAIGDAIAAKTDMLGRLIAREEGKTVREGVGEVQRAAELFHYYAGECLRQFEESAESLRPNVRIGIVREPVGVVAVIGPWNFPVALPSWKIAPALAYGNCVVYKPSELVPASSVAFAQLFAEAGLPDGVVNLVQGTGAAIGAALAAHDGVDAISFTGSAAVGRRVAEAGIRHMAKLQLEMGGKNPLVVLDDADLDRAVEAAVQGAFYATGQRCTASSRLIVTKGIHSRFVAALLDRMDGLRVGHALDEDTVLGPMVSETQLERCIGYLEIGKSEGAQLKRGGNRVRARTEGHYLEPALFVDTDNRMRINQEEIFGPVASVIVASDYDEALAIANDSDYGLTAGIMTSSDRLAAHFRRNAEAGVVTVNLPTVGLDFHVPFGGKKQSSYGPREQGTYARDFFMETRTAYWLETRELEGVRP